MKTVISVKVDTEVRDRAKRVAGRLGLPLSIIVNAQLRRFADDERIEFAVPLVPNAKTKKVIDKAMRDWTSGRMDQFSPAFTNTKDMDRYLDSLTT